MIALTARRDRHRVPRKRVPLQECLDHTRSGGAGPVLEPRRDPIRSLENSFVCALSGQRHLAFHFSRQGTSWTFASRSMPGYMEHRHFPIQFAPPARAPHEWQRSMIHVLPPVGSCIGSKFRRLERCRHDGIAQHVRSAARRLKPSVQPSSKRIQASVIAVGKLSKPCEWLVAGDVFTEAGAGRRF